MERTDTRKQNAGVQSAYSMDGNRGGPGRGALLPPINKRIPTVKESGTSTIRSDANSGLSLRRRLLAADADKEDDNQDFAVAGIGGLRAIQKLRNH
jgi:hypothetical protein